MSPFPPLVMLREAKNLMFFHQVKIIRHVHEDKNSHSTRNSS